MAWDPAYFSTLRVLDQVRFILAVPAKRVVNGAIARIFETELRRKRRRLVRDPAQITRDAARIWETKSYRGQPMMYSLSGLDEHGDMQNNRGSHYTGPSESKLSSFFEYASWGEIEDFADYCHRRSIELFVAWPAIMNDSNLVDSHPIVGWNIGQIVSHLKRAKVGVLGRPQDYYLDRGYFFDTIYHLNEEGRAFRTKQFVKDLKDALATDGSVAGR